MSYLKTNILIILFSLITVNLLSQSNRCGYKVISGDIKFKPKRSYEINKANIKFNGTTEYYIFNEDTLKHEIVTFNTNTKTVDLNNILLNLSCDSIKNNLCEFISLNLKNYEYVHYERKWDYYFIINEISDVYLETECFNLQHEWSRIKFDSVNRIIKKYDVEYYYDSIGRVSEVRMPYDSYFNWIKSCTYKDSSVFQYLDVFKGDSILDYTLNITAKYSNSMLISYEEYYADELFSNERIEFEYREDGILTKIKIFERANPTTEYKLAANYLIDIYTDGYINKRNIIEFNNRIIDKFIDNFEITTANK